MGPDKNHSVRSLATERIRACVLGSHSKVVEVVIEMKIEIEIEIELELELELEIEIEI